MWDPAGDEALNQSAAMRSFAGIDLRREAAPDEMTVFKCRHLLQHHRFSRQLLATNLDRLEGTVALTNLFMMGRHLLQLQV
jgi:IS5 family transposase